MSWAGVPGIVTYSSSLALEESSGLLDPEPSWPGPAAQLLSVQLLWPDWAGSFLLSSPRFTLLCPQKDLLLCDFWLFEHCRT